MIADNVEQTVRADLPPVGVNVMVQCEGFRCLAYRTPERKWVSSFSQQELKDVLRVLSWNEEPDSCVIPVNTKPGKLRRNRIPIQFHD